MAIWLKLVGAIDDPMPEHWLAGRSDLHEEVGFSKRASVDIGEELVLYAIPQGRVIGLAKVTGHPEWNGKHARWPWRSKIAFKLAIADYDRAPALSDIEEPDGRDLRKSVPRQSHIELRWGEYARARELLDAAFDPAQGDLRA